MRAFRELLEKINYVSTDCEMQYKMEEKYGMMSIKHRIKIITRETHYIYIVDILAIVSWI